MEGAERDAAALTAAKARLAAAERAQRATEWELEVCRQRLEQVGSECCWEDGCVFAGAYLDGCRCMCRMKLQESACRASGCYPHASPPTPATHSAGGARAGGAAAPF